MKYLAFVALPVAMLVSAAAVAQPVEVGVTDWDKLPPASVGYFDYHTLSDWSEQVMGSAKCRAAGYNPERFKVDQPYAVLLEPNGKVDRIVIAESKCPGLDYIVGLALQALSEARKFNATGASKPRWYGGRIRFEVTPQHP